MLRGRFLRQGGEPGGEEGNFFSMHGYFSVRQSRQVPRTFWNTPWEHFKTPRPLFAPADEGGDKADAKTQCCLGKMAP